MHCGNSHKKPLICKENFKSRLRNEVTNRVFRLTDLVKMLQFLKKSPYDVCGSKKLCPSSLALPPQRTALFLQFSESSLRRLCLLLLLSLSFSREILVSLLCCYSLYYSGTKRDQISHFFWSRQTPTSSLVIS